MNEQFKRLDRKLIHKGSIIDYYRDTILVPNGNIVEWDFVGHKGAAAIIAQQEDGKILMVHQYRNALDRDTIELPAGGLHDASENSKIAAMRELEEETGYKCSDAKFLIRIYTTVAFSDEIIDIYVAENLTKTQQNLDEDEFIKIKAYSILELKEMIYNGKIQDAKTVSGLLAFITKNGL